MRIEEMDKKINEFIEKEFDLYEQETENKESREQKLSFIKLFYKHHLLQNTIESIEISKVKNNPETIKKYEKELEQTTLLMEELKLGFDNMQNMSYEKIVNKFTIQLNKYERTKIENISNESFVSKLIKEITDNVFDKEKIQKEIIELEYNKLILKEYEKYIKTTSQDEVKINEIEKLMKLESDDKIESGDNYEVFGNLKKIQEFIHKEEEELGYSNNDILKQIKNKISKENLSFSIKRKLNLIEIGKVAPSNINESLFYFISKTNKDLNTKEVKNNIETTINKIVEKDPLLDINVKLYPDVNGNKLRRELKSYVSRASEFFMGSSSHIQKNKDVQNLLVQGSPIVLGAENDLNIEIIKSKRNSNSLFTNLNYTKTEELKLIEEVGKSLFTLNNINKYSLFSKIEKEEFRDKFRSNLLLNLVEKNLIEKTKIDNILEGEFHNTFDKYMKYFDESFFKENDKQQQIHNFQQQTIVNEALIKYKEYEKEYLEVYNSPNQNNLNMPLHPINRMLKENTTYSIALGLKELEKGDYIDFNPKTIEFETENFLEILNEVSINKNPNKSPNNYINEIISKISSSPNSLNFKYKKLISFLQSEDGINSIEKAFQIEENTNFNIKHLVNNLEKQLNNLEEESFDKKYQDPNLYVSKLKGYKLLDFKKQNSKENLYIESESEEKIFDFLYTKESNEIKFTKEDFRNCILSLKKQKLDITRLLKENISDGVGFKNKLDVLNEHFDTSSILEEYYEGMEFEKDIEKIQKSTKINTNFINNSLNDCDFESFLQTKTQLIDTEDLLFSEKESLQTKTITFKEQLKLWGVRYQNKDFFEEENIKSLICYKNGKLKMSVEESMKYIQNLANEKVLKKNLKKDAEDIIKVNREKIKNKIEESIKETDQIIEKAKNDVSNNILNLFNPIFMYKLFFDCFSLLVKKIALRVNKYLIEGNEKWVSKRLERIYGFNKTNDILSNICRKIEVNPYLNELTEGEISKKINNNLEEENLEEINLILNNAEVSNIKEIINKVYLNIDDKKTINNFISITKDGVITLKQEEIKKLLELSSLPLPIQEKEKKSIIDFLNKVAVQIKLNETSLKDDFNDILRDVVTTGKKINYIDNSTLFSDNNIKSSHFKDAVEDIKLISEEIIKSAKYSTPLFSGKKFKSLFQNMMTKIEETTNKTLNISNSKLSPMR